MKINPEIIPQAESLESAADRIGRKKVFGLSARKNRNAAGVLAERFMMAAISMEMYAESGEDVFRFIGEQTSESGEVDERALELIDQIRAQAEWMEDNIPWVLRRGFSHAVRSIAIQTSDRVSYSFQSDEVGDANSILDPVSGAEMEILERKDHFYTGKSDLVTHITAEGVRRLEALADEALEVARQLEEQEEDGYRRLEGLADECEESVSIARQAGEELYDIYRAGK